MSDPKNAKNEGPKKADEPKKKEEVKKDGELTEKALERVSGGFNPQPDPPRTPD